MAWALVVAHVLLPTAVAVVAAVGSWRCVRLLRYGKDPRLASLAWFYGLFAASLVPMAIWTGQVTATVGPTLADLPSLGSDRWLDWHGRYAGEQEVNAFLLAHHLLMLASLAVALRAYGRRRAGVAAVSLALLEPFVPVVVALEAGLALYLAVVAIRNHRERRTAGALQVAAGFLLFSLGHLSYFVLHHAGGARTPIGDVLSLVGLILLVQLLPRPTA